MNEEHFFYVWVVSVGLAFILSPMIYDGIFDGEGLSSNEGTVVHRHCEIDSEWGCDVHRHNITHRHEDLK